ncbi:MAG: GNAT family N-acetyltransferase [Mariprofundaceae bacterium]|nr:GNAT family N-acetyltransferase [Mariprofundaceae bacterium]
MTIRDAVKEDAGALAYLLNLAGEGIPEYLWGGMAEGDESALDAGRRRAARDEGAFSYTNARACVEDGIVLGAIISYRQPDPYPLDDLDEYPEIVQPLVRLEARSPGSWYINAIATFETHRGKGVARRLIADAEEQARLAGSTQMSLIVASENVNAKRLYEHIGFNTVESLPVTPYPGCLHGGDWVLMTKDL